MEALKKEVDALPLNNKQLLQCLVFMLHTVAEHSAENKMEAPSLATVFGPTIMASAIPEASLEDSLKNNKVSLENFKLVTLSGTM